MQYNTDGEPELRVTLGQTVSNADWYLQVAMGNITGATSVFKAGYNSAVTSEEALWEHGGLYPWASWDAYTGPGIWIGPGAPPVIGNIICNSTSASDDGQVHITGLKFDDWTEVTEIVTLNGTNQVYTTNTFIRINNVHYFHPTANVGNINLSLNGTSVAYIGAGLGQGQMAQYTVPAGHTAYLLNVSANIGKGNDGTGKFKYRTYGSNFQTAMVFLLYQSTFTFEFKAPLALPEKTDLDVTMLAANSNTPATCAYSMIIIDNTP